MEIDKFDFPFKSKVLLLKVYSSKVKMSQRKREFGVLKKYI